MSNELEINKLVYIAKPKPGGYSGAFSVEQRKNIYFFLLFFFLVFVPFSKVSRGGLYIACKQLYLGKDSLH
jgi:hypothetical protein